LLLVTPPPMQVAKRHGLSEVYSCYELGIVMARTLAQDKIAGREKRKIAAAAEREAGYLN